jgi:hypothetical protein
MPLEIRTPLDQASADWIFLVVSRRYEKGSIVLTSNRRYRDWDQVFADPVVASAIIDRLLHSATVLNIRGASACSRAGRTSRLRAGLRGEARSLWVPGGVTGDPLCARPRQAP